MYFRRGSVLDSMAWILNNQNKKKLSMDDQDNIRRFREKVRVHFICRAWIPEKPYEEFAERNMTEAEKQQKRKSVLQK